MQISPSIERYVDEFVELSLQFLSDAELRHDLADELAALTGLDRELLVNSSELFLDVACAKLVLECYPLFTDKPAYRNRQIGPRTCKELVRRSFVEFSRKSAALVETESEASPLPEATTGAAFGGTPAQRLAAFRCQLETQGVRGLSRLLLRRLARSQSTEFPITDGLCLMLSVLIVGTHFNHFWKAAAIVAEDEKRGEEPELLSFGGRLTGFTS